jgi:hypothetical protein
MPRRKLPEINEYIRQFLKDEFSSGGEYTWDSDELNLIIDQVLIEVATFSPRVVRETVTSDGTKYIDLSDIEDLIDDLEVEYPEGDFVNFNRRGDILTLMMNEAPAAGASVYLHCAKTHILTITESSLHPQEELLVIQGATARAAIARARVMINDINVGGAQAAEQLENWGIRRLAEYKSDLSKLNTEARSVKYT